MDLVFLVDGSGSVGQTNFDTQIQFLSDIIASLDISPTGSRVAMFQYSDSGRIEFGFLDNLSEIEFRLSIVPYMGGGTLTGGAIQATYSAFRNFARFRDLVIF